MKWEWIGGMLHVAKPLRPCEAIRLKRDIDKKMTDRHEDDVLGPDFEKEECE